MNTFTTPDMFDSRMIHVSSTEHGTEIGTITERSTGEWYAVSTFQLETNWHSYDRALKFLISVALKNLKKVKPAIDKQQKLIL
jgi:hypothetical protein